MLVVGGTGVTWFLGTLEGTLAGKPFLARVRYTRTWILDEEEGWRLIAAHVSPADRDTATGGWMAPPDRPLHATDQCT
ncbi:nuclear transport factor 2 family protein [Micromonospora sp. KC207]|uniref:nuclear transport factor 2 family protein n=1 Tax=Micromonospora sp. KC207 TaxID=2530377 RepID=UPI001FB593BA|nr:nuclear transport factor 2 family protein [Micromonospora sp. KC207]